MYYCPQKNPTLDLSPLLYNLLQISFKLLPIFLLKSFNSTKIGIDIKD